jgi:hypothetical protein
MARPHSIEEEIVAAEAVDTFSNFATMKIATMMQAVAS